MIEQTIRQQLPRRIPDRGVPARPRHARPRRAAGEPARRAAEDARSCTARGEAALPDDGRRGAGRPTRSAARARGRGTSCSSPANIDRPNTLEYVGYVFDDFLELARRPALRRGRGDRRRRRRGSVTSPVVVIGHQKGHTTSEMVERNFGMPQPRGLSQGAAADAATRRSSACRSSPSSTRRGRTRASARRSAASRSRSPRASWRCRGLPVPIVTVVTGEGGSGGALALAVGDRVLMMENSYYSVISPEGCSTILFKDAAQAPRAAEALRLTAPRPAAARNHGRGRAGARGRRPHRSGAAAANVKAAIVASLRELLGAPDRELLERRYDRFRKFGAPAANPPCPRSGRAQ